MRLRWVAEDDVSPARALATGSVLARRAAEGGAPVVLYGAGLSGEATLVLGRWQRTADAVALEVAEERGTPVLRRATGGPAATAGAGILYVALGLRNASSLMECPPDKVLNRNVRGILGGLAREGVPAHYFGREWISVEKRPAGLVSWTRAEGGVLIEMLLGHTKSFAVSDELSGYPPRKAEAQFLGKEPITLREAWEPAEQWEGRETASGVIRALAEGHTSRFEEVELDHSSLTDAERGAVTAQESSLPVHSKMESGGWSWSSPVEVPIGFVSAGLKRDDLGAVEDVQVAGDFMQDDEAPVLLQKNLVGKAPTADVIQAAVTATWDGSNRIIEGLKDTSPITSALRSAAGV